MSASSGYWVYVLVNPHGQHYIGLSENVVARLAQHNEGVSTWTRGKGPWKLVTQSQKMSLREARKLERQLKRQKGGRGLRHWLDGQQSSGS